MPCMCGDTGCGSCGPAQGYDPAFELVIDWLYEVILDGVDEDIKEDLAGTIAARLGMYTFADAMYWEARDWRDKQRVKNALEG